jgi:hypothetical protein
MTHAHRWAGLAVAAAVWGCGGNHERASESNCAEQPGAAADLCWSHAAIERAESNPGQALDLAQHITDVQTRDITILALFGKLPNPRDRLDACRAIQGTLSREKCLTYQQRPHLWVLADDTESTAPTTERPVTASTGVCAHLPAQLRDACALQTVLSSTAGVEANGQAAAIDQTRCSAISDANARAFCGTETRYRWRKYKVWTPASRPVEASRAPSLATSATFAFGRYAPMRRWRSRWPPVAWRVICSDRVW